ncbi:hypothetical protein OG455_00660 [Kitasatospora sp. NBC_01287]|uniref:hypothetical protein n=1 Tax=Kitasatospora sp. NBC_01287 TaxID=2903573 RepID=UPI00225347BB|nr:hypothetical protein [Kitasatospora sp. NBC_01287]MCX4744036.1 hypothetical protein [Kitasatospora sp. NBC_01287]
MVGLVLLGVLALVVGGCACVVWADRGGPRWVRGVAAATLAAGQLVCRSEESRRRRRSLKRNTGDSD